MSRPACLRRAALRAACGAWVVALANGCSSEEPATWAGTDASLPAVDASGDSASQADESLPLDASEDVSQPDATGLDATASDAGPEGGGAAGFRAARELVMSHLADPDVFKVSDDLFLLTGTGTTTSFDIHASSDLQTFQLKTTYAPSSLPGAWVSAISSSG